MEKICVSFSMLGVFFFSLVFFVPACICEVLPASRVALLIGNSNYPVVPLPNPVKDVSALAQQLAVSGFKTLKHTDLDQQSLYDAVDSFAIQSSNSSEVLFFYAGHAIQVNGKNYLIPISADFKSEDLLSQLFDLRYLMDKLSSIKSARVRIIILDACRDNPFSRHPLAASGLAEINAPVGTFIAFSTAPGKTAEDGEGDSSPYMTHLLKTLSIPGKKIEDVFKEVRAKVNLATKGSQIPWEATSLETDFYFWPNPAYSETFSAKPVGTVKKKQKRSKETQKRCNAILMKISLGMEVLSVEEQKYLQTECR